MSKFRRELYYKKYVYVIAYVSFTFIIYISKLFTGNLLNITITVTATALLGHFLYNNKKIYILYYSIFIVILAIFQFLVSFFFQLICFYLNINFYNFDIFAITVSIITQFANLSASRLFILCFKKKEINKITALQYLNFLVLPLFSIFYITTLMMYIQTYLALEDIVLLLLNIMSIMVLNIFITNIFQSISKNNQLKSELELYEQQAKLQYNYYTSLEDKYKNSRKIIHDMKNHLQTIENLYKLQENEKAMEYTADMYSMFDKFVHKYYTSNKVLNIIINDKIQNAESFNISFDCKIEDISFDFIRDIDQTTIFSNLLDNAVEAVKKLPDGKNITLKINKFNDFIIINITNSIGSLPTKNTAGFTSTKKNHEALGLQNVSRALEKYEGNMRVDYDEKNFRVNIVIPSN
jgi:sensor histidine kinase YesM